MRTSYPAPAKPSWYVIDAEGKTLGRLAAQIAHVLRGKHKKDFSPHMLQSDHIVVLNAGKVVLRGKKMEQKEYFRHTGTLGRLRRIPVKRVLAEDPTKVLLRAVTGMLPRNNRKPEMLEHLHLFETAEHPHAAQQPQPFEKISPARK
jgi:large subunit ribosomal protein L13